MLKIYSIKEIVEATNNLLAVSNEVKEQLIIDPNNSPKEKYSSKKSIPKDIESIILEAENSQIQKKENNSPNISSQEEKDSFEELKVSKDELVESMYKTFSKKIKKNTLKLILELREEVIFSTKKISSLEKLQKLEENNKEILKKDIIDLEHIKNEIKNELEKSQDNFISLKKQHEDLNLQYNLLKVEHKNLSIENISLKKSFSNLRKILIQLSNQTIFLKDDNIKINSQLDGYKNKELRLTSEIKKMKETSLVNRSLEISNQEIKNSLSIYIKKNKELQNEIDELKNNPIKVINNNDHLDDIKELENKVKHYQDENIRISNEYVESNKKFEITKERLNELQKHRGDLIEKIKSINEVIQNENIVTSVFNSGLEEDKTKIIDEQKTIKKDISDLDDKIKNIFSKN